MLMKHFVAKGYITLLITFPFVRDNTHTKLINSIYVHIYELLSEIEFNPVLLHQDGRLEHKEFLGDENRDQRRDLAKQMLKDITPTGSIIAFNQSFEITQIKNLAQVCPDLSDELLSLNERFIDLAHPFQYKHYYHPKFNGRYSIKVVLPTLFPNDDELDYKKLGSIQNGGDAMDTFANLHLLKNKDRLDSIKKDLLAYCRLDTLAMVRIWEKLYQITGGIR